MAKLLVGGVATNRVSYHPYNIFRAVGNDDSCHMIEMKSSN